MKVVILAGGFGTRISEESQLIPKPMIEIGGKPILWHIMKEYSHFGYNEFIICAGYKQHVIKSFFADYALHNSDVTFDFQGDNRVSVHNNFSEPWKVTVVDTGYDSLTGKRIKLIQPYIDGDNFFLTYGDGVSDVNIKELLKFHEAHGKICTITAVKPDSRFGYIDFAGDKVLAFREKSKEDVGWINAGYMVMNAAVFDYLDGNFMLEQEPMRKLTAAGEVMAYRHEGFWQCMDTLRDKNKLEELWQKGAPWKIWN
ncbi:MAG: glucose-1-phosphate cytidylyltransferase [Selenomonadaceae bacterium]|nr:glucose-1-phosphate cytidylyltransferase [Selenomonadaceae bacterium]MBQ6757919.1 glucose-1-phosphate cytidylyltransferase [Selenomonadaceae bacterium]